MIFPLLLLVLGVGAVSALAFSPDARKWVDEHLMHTADAAASDKVADTHLDVAVTASSAGDAAKVAQNLDAATVMNQITAAKTAQMAQTAKTQKERAITALMADLATARQIEIDEAKQQLIAMLTQEARLASVARAQAAHARAALATTTLAQLGVTK